MPPGMEENIYISGVLGFKCCQLNSVFLFEVVNGFVFVYN